MPKNSVTDWDETAANNTDIAGIDIDEGCAPSGINNAIRTAMAQVRSFFKSTLFRLRDSTDQTKLLAFDLSGLTTATTRTLTVPDKNGTLAMTSDTAGSSPVGQCRIALSGGNIVLRPFGGDKIRIAGSLYAIPSAGVSLAPAGLSVGADLYIYAYMSGATMTLEASATGHSTSSTAGNVGVEIKTGDDSRTLVGYAGIVTGPAFANSASRRLVLNWFNRQGIGAQNEFTADRSTASGTFVEVNSEIRCEFLTWENEALSASVSGSTNNSSAGRGVISALGIDGGNAEFAQPYGVSTSASADTSYAATVLRTMTEGRHFYTLLGRTDGVGTATYRSSAALNGRTLLTVMTMG